MNEPIIIEGNEQSRVDPNLPDAGLPPAVGVQSFQVFRATRDVPEIADNNGWTYHHHVDMACWRGRLYVGWNSCEKDEDVWPSREWYSTSIDGSHWSDPIEMFPQGVSTPLRMYFYLAPHGRMLMIAGLRPDTSNTDEDTKGGLVVREIYPDHTVGKLFILQLSPLTEDQIARIAQPTEPGRAAPDRAGTARLSPLRDPGDFPHFEQSPDEGFVEACRALLIDRVFLEQQDRGRLLGSRRMKWHDPANWPGGKVPGDSEKWVAGKAYSFFRRPDNTLVGISKMGWVTTSTDDGETWAQPLVPLSLITGKAKVWSQRTSDDRYALAYNPSRKNRFPLVIVTGDDGVRFRDMRIVQGELPIQRYEGVFRSIGPQYTRGLSMWSDDGSRPQDNCMWLVYSMSKEDIWVNRVPLPVKPDEVEPVDDDFSRFAPGPIIPNWNTYCPKWCRVEIADGALLLERRDPYDHPIATRVFPQASAVAVTFNVERVTPDADPLEVDALTKFGSMRAKSIQVNQSGEVRLEATGDTLNRIAFRLGPHRGIGGTQPVPPGSDHPRDPMTWRIRNLRISDLSGRRS